MYLGTRYWNGIPVSEEELKQKPVGAAALSHALHGTAGKPPLEQKLPGRRQNPEPEKTKRRKETPRPSSFPSDETIG